MTPLVKHTKTSLLKPTRRRKYPKFLKVAAQKMSHCNRELWWPSSEEQENRIITRILSRYFYGRFNVSISTLGFISKYVILGNISYKGRKLQ
jgi:hypothetical protein